MKVREKLNLTRSNVDEINELLSEESGSESDNQPHVQRMAKIAQNLDFIAGGSPSSKR